MARRRRHAARERGAAKDEVGVLQYHEDSWMGSTTSSGHRFGAAV